MASCRRVPRDFLPTEGTRTYGRIDILERAEDRNNFKILIQVNAPQIIGVTFQPHCEDIKLFFILLPI